MTPERWQRVLEVFQSACSQPPTQAEAFVRAQCGQDAEMCSEVLRMVGEHARGGMLDGSPWEAVTVTEPALGQPVFPPGQLVSGRYRIVGFLGRGGMGEVYQAEDLELKDHVALKTLLPAIASDGRMLARFKQEIQLSRKVSHPNVCRVFDLARHPADGPSSTLFLTMEFLPGETLTARLRREGRLSADAALPILAQMAEALDAAHRAGVIHRDFKPSNVMLVPTAAGTRAVVTDFGLARSCAPSGETTVTLTGTLMGTLDYMAPELLSGEAATVASDVYAFGTVAYKMVTGALPFPSNAPLAGAILRSKGPAPSPKTLAPDLDEKWEQAILCALHPDPDRRFARPGHFIKALQGEAPSVSVALPRLTRRRLVAALAAVVLLVGGIGWWQWRRSRNQPTPEGLRWYQTGAAALRDATYYRAVRALERSVSIDPGFALAHARLAEAWNELDDSEKAKEEMLRALADQSSHPPVRQADALYVDAIHRTLVGDYPGAIAAYTSLAGKVAEAEAPQVLVDLGRARERNYEVAKALEEYRKAARQDPQNAAAHLRAAILLGRQGKYDAATAEFDQADSLYQALSNTAGQAEVLYQRGLLASGLRKLPEARDAVEKAIQLARAITAEHQEIAATLQLGMVTYLEGNAARAEQIASETVERARRSGLANLAARGLTDLGIFRTGRGDYAGGESRLREAIDLARRFRLPRNQARARLQLASALQEQGKAQAALQEAEPALAYYRQAGFLVETSQALTVLARTHRDLGNYDQARTEFEQLLSLAAAADDPRQVMTAEQGVASFLFQLDRWPEALGHFEQHHKLADQLRVRDSIGLGLLNRAKVLWRLGRYSDAEKLLAEARTVSAQPGSDIRFPSLIASHGAEMALSRNLFAEAGALAQRVLRMESATKRTQADVGCVAGLARARAGSVQEGKRLCDEAVSIASGLSDQATLLDNRLALAEILVAGGQPKAAVEQARPALDSSQKAGRKESVWRCWSILARAYRLDGDLVHAADAAAHAAASLAELRTLWGQADFERYRQRRDIQAYLRANSK